MFTSTKACPTFEYDTLTRFLTKYSYLLGAVLIGGGLFLGFFGNKFVNFVIGLVGFLVASVVLLKTAFWGVEKSNKTPEEWVMWVVFAACLLLAGFVGSLLVKARKVGISILAGWGGVLLGLMLTTTLVISNNYIHWGIVVVSAGACAYAAFKLERMAIMLATAFIGSYLSVRGVSLYAGGFPNESSLQYELQTGTLDWSTFPKSFYGYLAGIVFLMLVSFMFQRKHDISEQKRILALSENNMLLNNEDKLTYDDLTPEQKRKITKDQFKKMTKEQKREFLEAEKAHIAQVNNMV